MRIGIVVDNELNNDKRVLREADILKEHGYEIFILCFGFDNNIYCNIAGINITRIKIRKRTKDILFFILNSISIYEWFWSLRIKKFIINNHLEVLHVHDLYMSRAAHSGRKKAGKKIPVILDLHENYPFAVTTYNWTKGFLRSLISRPKEWKRKEKEYLGYSDKVVVLSEEFKEDLINRYPELKEKEFLVLPNVPDLRQLEQSNTNLVKIPFKKTAPIIFYFGVIAERRGVFNALRVFSELIKENNRAVFLLIGPVDKKDKKSFFTIIHSETLANHVRYIPWIDLSELPAYLEISDICIAPFEKNPQHESGVANKIFDYMSGKKPIVASDCRPQQKLIEKYNCGIVYRNDTEMKNAIIKLLSNKQLNMEMGLNGYKAVMEEFNTDKVKEQLLKFYSEIEAVASKDRSKDSI